MKAFEAWWIQFCKKEDTYPHDVGLRSDRNLRESGWRSALEWMKRQIPNTWDVSTGEISEIIDEELESE